MGTKRKYREQYLRWHKGYEKRTTTAFKKMFKGFIKDIDWDNMQGGTYKIIVSMAVNEEKIKETLVDTYLAIGKQHGKRVGKATEKATKAFDLTTFLTIFNRNVYLFLNLFGGRRITTIRQTFISSVIDLLSNRVSNGMDMRQAAKEVRLLVNKPKFYTWMALRIARTESTAASNFAAIESSRSNDVETIKEWLSASDGRTRRKPEAHFDHFVMQGVQVDIDDDFIFNEGTFDEDRLQFPGDPKGKAGNIINCRCSVVVLPKRDKEGQIIFKT